jgi:hypothetical protein
VHLKCLTDWEEVEHDTAFFHDPMAIAYRDMKEDIEDRISTSKSAGVVERLLILKVYIEHRAMREQGVLV